jgi:hypothetical protein
VFIPHRLRFGSMAAGAVAGLLAVAGCGSGTAVSASSDGGSSSNQAVTVDIAGGEYAWIPPKVVPASTPQGRPVVSPSAGRDPVTGSTMMRIVQGDGAKVTDPNQVRVRYLRQSWDGKHIAHDTWQSSGPAEPVPIDGSAPRIVLAVLYAHVGDLVEVVAPVSATEAVAGQSAVLVIAIEAS